jgi:hypothetical protein
MPAAFSDMSMQPSTTGHPAPEAIVAFIDGDATPEVESHIQGCMTCAADAEELASAASALTSRLYRFDCPTPHRLGEYELGILESGERMRIATHALECDACMGELHTLRAFMAVDPVVPESFMERARRVLAMLVAPTPGLGYAGVRGADTQLRQYRAEGAQVSIEAGPESGSLIGLLVLDEGRSPIGQARLLLADGAVHEASIDEFGNFDFEDVPNGSYALELHLADEIIVIQQLQI